MRVAVTGATGFIGRRLATHLLAAGHEVVALVRDEAAAEDILPPAAVLRAYDAYDADDVRKALAGCTAIVNLAGENVFGARWSSAVRKSLRDSRVVTTRALFEAIEPLPLEQRPRTIVSASAIGYYGDRGPERDCRENEHRATELTPSDFLAHLCAEWESAARRLEVLGLRVVRARFGVVLGRGGGALAPMEPVAKKHISVRMGSGKQIVSWIHIEDLLAAVTFALEREALRGPVNVTAPNPVTNAELARALARTLGKRAWAPGMPGFVAKLVFGKGRAGMLLGGQRVLPYVLEEHGLRFRFPTLPEALAHLYAGANGAPR